MQLIGIYITDGDSKVLKNLKEGWYPFIKTGEGKLSADFSKKEASERIKLIKSELENNSVYKNNKKFINTLYSVDDKAANNSNSSISHKSPNISLNCIVGKNGSGKSSLLSLEYRIINNLSCKIMSHLKFYNQDYTPIWATGFNAELYYELQTSVDNKIENTIYCIKVSNNETLDININASTEKNREVELLSDKGDILQSFFNEIENLPPDSNDRKIKEDKLLEAIGKHFFYTIGTNYSLYTNSVVTDEYDENEELWMHNIFHKNDGYFTPIVLVPYKNQWTTVDTKKELNLAKERVSTLSFLIYAQTGNEFIEDYIPQKICYKLKENAKGVFLEDGKEVGYNYEIRKKLIKAIKKDDIEDKYVEEILKEYNETYKLAQLFNDVKSKWKEQLFDNQQEQYIEIWNNNIDNSITHTSDEQLFQTIKNNTLDYLAYKTIKICLFYDTYKNKFSSEYEYNILNEYSDDISRKDCLNVIEKLISDLLIPDSKTDFTNLKIKQCIHFLNNMACYLKNYKYEELIKGVEIPIRELKAKIYLKDDFPGKAKLSYDYVFQNLLPPYFYKQFYFKKEKEISGKDIENKETTISSLSSGESQLLNSISYSVYHIKNAISSKIGYKNINLVFDEAELYYHPEYQRRFINDLLGIIRRSNLTEVDAINISIVTHSPFILSDVPSSNIMQLEEGQVKYNDEKTFCSNYYDLLKNKFFLDSSIGKLAEKYINEILDVYNIVERKLNSSGKLKDNKNPLNNEEEKIKDTYLSKEKGNQFYSMLIENIGDNYLHKSLLNCHERIMSSCEKDYFNKLQQEKITKLYEQLPANLQQEILKSFEEKKINVEN